MQGLAIRMHERKQSRSSEEGKESFPYSLHNFPSWHSHFTAALAARSRRRLRQLWWRMDGKGSKLVRREGNMRASPLLIPLPLPHPLSHSPSAHPFTPCLVLSCPKSCSSSMKPKAARRAIANQGSQSSRVSLWLDRVTICPCCPSTLLFSPKPCSPWLAGPWCAIPLNG